MQKHNFAFLGILHTKISKTKVSPKKLSFFSFIGWMEALSLSQSDLPP